MSAYPVSSQRTGDPWLVVLAPRPAARLRLICFHYAGGGAHAYRTWDRSLPPSIEVVAVQFPGRGARLREEPLTSVDVLLPALMEGLLPALSKPFAFFGHSMGALIAFEVTRSLRRLRKTLPVHLFVSGRGGPRERDWDVKLSDLPEEELIAELVRYGGAPKEVLENTELMRLMLPTIRADFKVCETYSYVREEPLDCPISACNGVEDFELKQERLEAWRDETSTFKSRMFPGSHFYLQKSEHSILQAIVRDLESFL
ncbi:MAG TPA: alpha/beta fold hydrolase [Pyrinomonadaceae bacterium]|nr:alpha/beta fold hydrolase [Pyrinomonadaceae bacterium]